MERDSSSLGSSSVQAAVGGGAGAPPLAKTHQVRGANRSGTNLTVKKYNPCHSLFHTIDSHRHPNPNHHNKHSIKMKLSTSTTAAILAVLAFVQGAAAVDFDFRAFEVSFARFVLQLYVFLPDNVRLEN